MLQFHEIEKYAYSYTLTNNDVAAKLSLWKTTTDNNEVKVADINFMYDNDIIPAPVIQDDAEYALLYMPVKTLLGIIDILRNEKPLILTLNAPFAFLGTNALEPVGDGEPLSV